MKKTALFLIFTWVASLNVSAQTHAKKGNYSFLKGEKELKISFDYSDMKVGKSLTENEYIEEKVEEYNKKEAGTGDKWKESWITSRKERYEPKFESLINKSMSDIGLVASQNASSKYSLIVKTTFTEPGFNVGVVRRPSAVDFELIFIETASKKEIAKYVLLKIPGSQAMGFDFDTGSRIAESYAKCGKMIGDYISKQIN